MADPIATIEQRLNRRLLAAAVLLQAEHKGDLSKTYPPASAPGQFPAARTFNLRDSPTVVPIPGGYRVGYLVNASYIVWLVKRGRLGLIDTLNRIRPRLLKIIRGA